MKAMIQSEHLDYPAKVQQIVSVDEQPEPFGVDRFNFLKKHKIAIQFFNSKKFFESLPVNYSKK
jgi:hypothetical protein